MMIIKLLPTCVFLFFLSEIELKQFSLVKPFNFKGICPLQVQTQTFTFTWNLKYMNPQITMQVKNVAMLNTLLKFKVTIIIKPKICHTFYNGIVLVNTAKTINIKEKIL